MSEVDSSSILGTFVLSDLLALDPVLQVESSKGSDCDSLVGELTMKKYRSNLESKSRHNFQGLIARQPVNVFLVEFKEELFRGDFFHWRDSLRAYMLDRAV